MDDDHLIPLSALQHYLYCPRQCALIHIDGLWAENRLTAEGTILHSRVDTPGYRTKHLPPSEHGAVRTVHAMPLLCKRLGIVGKADCVEFPLDAKGYSAGPPRPVEHKRGKPKRHDADRVQLCAQALCLEEMTGQEILEGDLFYNIVRKRERVIFNHLLRQRTIETIQAVRDLIRNNTTPPARYGPKCRNCSLLNLCLPKGTGSNRNPGLYLSRSISTALAKTWDKP